MSEISKAAWRQASELFEDEFDAVVGTDSIDRCKLRALARVLQEHSDAAKDVNRCFGPSHWARKKLKPLILPAEPADPLKLAMKAAYGAAAPEFVSAAYTALDEAGYEIRRKGAK